MLAHLHSALATEQILAETRNFDMQVGGWCLHAAFCVAGHFCVCVLMCLCFNFFYLICVTSHTSLLANESVSGSTSNAVFHLWANLLYETCLICNPVRVTVFAVLSAEMNQCR